MSRVARTLAALPGPPLAPLLAPLDALRARLFRALAPLAPTVFVARDQRVTLVGSLLLLSAYLGATTFPVWILALGPIVWGIPHILSDTRYMVARPGLHKRPAIMIVMACGVLAAGAGAGIRGALLAAIGVLLLARGSVGRRAIGILVALVCLGLAQWAEWRADIIFGHLHNVVAVALWWAWRRRPSRLHWLPLTLFAMGTLLLLGGAADGLLQRTGGLHAPSTGLSLTALMRSLSPTDDALWSRRLVVYYAFAQTAHYIVWMRLIPEDDRRSKSPRSFAQSYRALRADLGGIILWGALFAALALAAWAFVRLGEARDGYLQLAFFHGYIEVIAAALLWGERALPLGEVPLRIAPSPALSPPAS